MSAAALVINSSKFFLLNYQTFRPSLSASGNRHCTWRLPVSLLTTYSLTWRSVFYTHEHVYLGWVTA
jgi:hypothetical protein